MADFTTISSLWKSCLKLLTRGHIANPVNEPWHCFKVIISGGKELKFRWKILWIEPGAKWPENQLRVYLGCIHDRLSVEGKGLALNTSILSFNVSFGQGFNGEQFWHHALPLSLQVIAGIMQIVHPQWIWWHHAQDPTCHQNILKQCPSSNISSVTFNQQTHQYTTYDTEKTKKQSQQNVRFIKKHMALINFFVRVPCKVDRSSIKAWDDPTKSLGFIETSDFISNRNLQPPSFCFSWFTWSQIRKSSIIPPKKKKTILLGGWTKPFETKTPEY